jgi:hypothetical protein
MRMRLLVLLLIALSVSIFFTIAQSQQIGKVVTIPQLQIVSMDSLVKLDGSQGASSGTSLDDSPYWHGADTKADTVRVTGVVIVKPSILTYTLQRYNTYIQDTTTGQLWGGLNVLTDDSSANAQNTGIPAIDTGMVVTITGRVTEYGSQPNSLTEMFAYKSGFFQTVVGIEINSLYKNTGNRPAPIEVTCDSFAIGTTPKPSRGEKYEGMYVIIRNVTVSSVNQGNGSFSFQDDKGNWMQMYDGSGYYTLRGHRATNSTYIPPPVGTKLKYIRGVVLPQTRTGTCGDYTIMPLYPGPKELKNSTYPGDIGIDKYGPAITTVLRKPTPPKPTDVVNITYKSYDPSTPILNTKKADSTFFRYRVGTQTNQYGTGGVRIKVDSTAGDSLYHTQIPAQSEGSLVSYYVESWLNGVYSAFPDSSTPYFYVVRNAGPTLYDVVMSPYINASTSGFAYDTVTVSGVIVADTSDIKDLTTRGGRSNAPLLWLQAGTSSTTNKFNGILIWSPLGPIVDTLKRGDSVSVRGSVYGTSNRISIAVTSMPYFRRGGSVMPAPFVRSMSSSPYFDYSLSNTAIVGNAAFQPWLSTLQQLNDMYILYRNADNPTNDPASSAVYGEYFVSNVNTPIAMTTFGIRVNDNGMNHFYCDTNSIYIKGGLYSYNSTHPLTADLKGNKAFLIPLLAKVSYIRGMLDYTNGNYKLEPRKDDDFGTIVTGVFMEANSTPKKFTLEQNFPNPFNPSTTIRYSVPARSNVTLKIYNILGQQVESLINMEQGVGSYVIQYNASRLATGVYFYELRAGDYRDIKKMLLLK